MSLILFIISSGGKSEPDWAEMSELDFERNCVFHVPDRIGVAPGESSLARSSLPPNLALRPSQHLRDVSDTAIT